jgi:hypothetical protein
MAPVEAVIATKILARIGIEYSIDGILPILAGRPRFGAHELKLQIALSGLCRIRKGIAGSVHSYHSPCPTKTLSILNAFIGTACPSQ